MRDPWDTSLPDWEERIIAQRPLVPDLPLFRDEAERALRIFRRLRLPDVIGKPTMAEAAGEWFLPVVSALFGSYDPATNRRMISEFFFLVPKKNAKSSNGGAIMVVALIVNRRPEGEFLFVAPTKEIADIAFKQASGTVRADPELEKLFHIQRHIRLITHRRTGATLQIKASDTDVITGSKALGTMIDETHVFAKRARAADVFIELRGALAARPDGFLFQTTTQSKEPPTGVFKAELKSARDVRDGKLRIPLLPILYELPHRLAKDGGWKNPAYWPMVNPNLGRSVDLGFLQSSLRTAEDRGPQALALLASQHFNVEIGLSQRTDNWPGAEHWLRREDPTITVESMLARCEVIVAGIDGGGLDDLLGFSLVGREPTEIEVISAGDDGPRPMKTKRWLCWQHAWCHRGVLDRRPAIAPRLLEAEAAGELTIVDDELSDLSSLVAIVDRVKEAGVLGGVGVDPAAIGELVDLLDGIDVTQDNKLLFGIAQGYRLMNAIKSSERRLAAGTLIHAVSKLMDWCVGNVRIEALATSIRATKQFAGEAKIDPWAALMNACDLMGTNPTAGGVSIYETLSDEEAAALGLDDAAPVRPAAGDAAILANPAHPEWEAARERFELALAARDDDGDA